MEDTTRRFVLLNRRSLTSETGKHAWSFGIRAGYWPCLKAPFVNIEFATWRIDMWHGLPSKETGRENRK